MDLPDHSPACHCIVMHIGSEISETPRRKTSHLGFIKPVSHADFEGPADDSDVFPIGVPMWRDPISIRHLQPYRIVSRGSTWIALKDCKLRTRGHKRRSWTIWNCIGCECVFRGAGLSSARVNQSYAT